MIKKIYEDLKKLLILDLDMLSYDRANAILHYFGVDTKDWLPADEMSHEQLLKELTGVWLYKPHLNEDTASLRKRLNVLRRFDAILCTDEQRKQVRNTLRNNMIESIQEPFLVTTVIVYLKIEGKPATFYLFVDDENQVVHAMFEYDTDIMKMLLYDAQLLFDLIEVERSDHEQEMHLL